MAFQFVFKMHITGSKSSECVARSTAVVFPGNTKEAGGGGGGGGG